MKSVLCVLPFLSPQSSQWMSPSTEIKKKKKRLRHNRTSQLKDDICVFQLISMSTSVDGLRLGSSGLGKNRNKKAHHLSKEKNALCLSVPKIWNFSCNSCINCTT